MSIRMTYPKFPGYDVLKPLRSGGAGADMYIAQPMRSKCRELKERRRAPGDLVVIKAFRNFTGIVAREIEAMPSAEGLGLVLEKKGPESGPREVSYWYVMPYVSGVPLDSLIDDLHAAAPAEGLQEDALRRALDIFCQLLDDLRRFHEHGVHHRDIKPANIIVGRDAVSLIDIGLLSRRGFPVETASGTLPYRDLALEEVAEGRRDPSDSDERLFDLYGVAASLYHLIEGVPPTPRRALKPNKKRAPRALWSVIGKASIANLSERYQTASAMRADLEVLRDAVHLSTLEPKDLPSEGGRPELLPTHRLVLGANLEGFPELGDREDENDPSRAPGRRKSALMVLMALLFIGVLGVASTPAGRAWFWELAEDLGIQDSISSNEIGAAPPVPARNRVRGPVTKLPGRAELADALDAVAHEGSPGAGAWVSQDQLESPLRLLWLPARPGPRDSRLETVAETLAESGDWSIQGEALDAYPADPTLIWRARSAIGNYLPNRVEEANAAIAGFLRVEGLAGLIWYDVSTPDDPTVLVFSIFPEAVGARLGKPVHAALIDD